MPKGKKIAIVYDWIDKWGGVERVLLTLHEMFREAQFYASCYDPEKAPWAKRIKIKTSFIQNLPKFIRGSRIASLPFYPYAFESLDFSNYDLVISVTSSFAKSIITKPGTNHICYLLTPTRYLWINENLYFKNNLVKTILQPYLKSLKRWDFVAAQRPDKIISISQTAADRCKWYYKRESEMIYPPFDVEYWNKIKSKIQNPNVKSNPKSKIQSLRQQKYYLVVSRLEPYKSINLVIKTFNLLNKSSLIIVGEGSELNRLKQISGENILLLSKLTDQELGYLYSNAEALIMPQEEDFGYVSLEAQFFGCPVIAYKKGGATETVIEGKTGIFFREQTEKALQSALERFDIIKYNLRKATQEFGIKNVEKFSKAKFINKFKDIS